MVRVEAKSIEDAVRYVNGHECLMPEGYYVDDSLNVDYEMIEEEAKSHELIRCDRIPVAFLDTVFRQASNSRIAMNAHAVNHNDTHLLYGDDFCLYEVADAEEAAALVTKCYLEEAGKVGTENVQILAPFRKRGLVSVNAINEAIQKLVNPHSARVAEVKYGQRIYRVGDRIMQTKNRTDVSNGDVGRIDRISVDEDDECRINVTLLDGREIQYSKDQLEDVDLAYAMATITVS